jgi:hypothetical protein
MYCLSPLFSPLSPFLSLSFSSLSSLPLSFLYPFTSLSPLSFLSSILFFYLSFYLLLFFYPLVSPLSSLLFLFHFLLFIYM